MRVIPVCASFKRAVYDSPGASTLDPHRSPLHRDIAEPISHGSQVVAAESVRRHGRAALEHDVEGRRAARDAHPLERRRFRAQDLPRWLFRSVHIHHAVHTLLHRSRAAVADVRPVVVVVEKNQAGDVSRARGTPGRGARRTLTRLPSPSGRSAVQAQYPYSEITIGLSGKARWISSRLRGESDRECRRTSSRNTRST